MKQIYSFLLIFFVGITLAGCDSTTKLETVVAKTIDGVVVVYIDKNEIDEKTKKEIKISSHGTGFFIQENLIVTNEHVIDHANNITIKNSRTNKKYKAKLIASDKMSDIALLSIVDWQHYSIDEKWKSLKFSPSKNLKLGQRVWTFGHPWGLEYTVSDGIISSLDRRIDATPQYFIQTDARIYQGNSGGPLLDYDGHVIGVNSRVFTNGGGSYGFSISGDFVQRVIKQLKLNNEVYWYSIGVAVDNSGEKLAVKKLDPAGIGKRYGLEVGDNIVKIISPYTPREGRNIRSIDDLLIVLSMLEEKDIFWIVVERRGDTKILPMIAQKK